ncbi:ExeM/NucH family extracellular endonuclease [Beutenbergia cavernae]|uniref:ExeM/NucH family extracellular endonuclease n=1 Tax=Beutenbergia cavernae TaxID=84757 RepID=UPI00068244A8
MVVEGDVVGSAVRTRVTGGIGALALAVVGIGAAPLAAQAAVSPDAPVVVAEVYGGGGNSGAVYSHDFIELANTSDAVVDLAGWSVQYASAAGTNWSGVIPLAGSIEPGARYLVQAGTNNAGVGQPLPAPDATGSANLSATNGNIALVSAGGALQCDAAACAADAAVVDLVGFGTGAAFAGTGPAPSPSNSTSIARDADLTNTAANAADFTVGAPTPDAAGGGDPDPDPVTATIAEIQGDGAASPLVGSTVVTRGVVTAAYPTGGFDGYVIQTPGTGGVLDLATHTTSQAVFVYSAATVGQVAIGDHVEVTGVVSEFFGLTEITVGADGLSVLSEPADDVAPAQLAGWPADGAQRESLESMLYLPEGAFTVSDTYNTNRWGEVTLAAGEEPLRQPTDVARPGSPEAAAVVADNAAREVRLDDGATTDFLEPANSGLTPPYISLTDPVRVGAAATFGAAVVVDFRNDVWKLNPVAHVTPADPGAYPATFANTRTDAPDAAAIGDTGDDAVRLASFNVLNYFTTLGTDGATCVPYTDRAGDGVTVEEGCDQRGAWDAEDFQRQQDKIVAAINGLDADVVGLMEIENSAALGETADEALGALVAALNAAAGADVWAFVPSSAELPPVELQDVITNAIIYRPGAVTPVGEPRALGTQSAEGQPFANAREPIGQVFAPAGGGEDVFVVVNHFKSKGSPGPLPGDEDSGDGQGASNASRVAQATALRDWVGQVAAADDAVALLGDFNSYGQEDPLHVLYDAGYTDVEAHFDVDGSSYSFGRQSGSLDHVLLNAPALARATGADIWEINSGEAVALEYSRHNYHGTLFYDATAYRSSDHDPVLVGLAAGDSEPTGPVDLTLLNINDFHGRIDGNTVAFAGTVEEQRAAAEAAGGSAVFLSAGDNIGASLFASSVQQDQPTIDVLNALELAASAVGNHEFDAGYADLVDRVIAGGSNAQWGYLGANVYEAGTTTPALDEYRLVESGGVTVGVIGAVTEETPTLVRPGGISTLEFGNPVEAVNRVAAQLTDGDEANGEADVIVAEYHEGAGAGTPDGSTLEEEVAAGGAFAQIVNETSPLVDAIFTGHTHKQYAWDAPIPGSTETRPIVQTGSYGEFIGQVVLTYDATTDDVTAYTAENVARTATPADQLIATYPRVSEVNDIVTAALAYAEEIGEQPVGSVAADITTAFSGGSYVNGVYVGPGPEPTSGRDDRASESSLGGLVANALLDTLADADLGGAEIGVVNPGGMRAELLYAPDGVVTYAEANAVLPFVNNLWTTTLTGEQVKLMLEQQWQRTDEGEVPSRPYLQLGLSSNVTYTFDASRPEGDRITSITVNGAPLDPAAPYRIGTFSFLAEGGDNFHVFADGADTRDSGLIDRDAWIAYLEAHPGLEPDFARQAVSVPELPETEAGAEVAFDVTGLNLTSLGSPENTALTASFDGAELGEFAVADGAASVALTVPADATAGAHTLTLVAAPSGTTVTVPITVSEAAPPTVGSETSLWLSQTTYRSGSWLPIIAFSHVELDDGRFPRGRVEIREGDQVVASARVVLGVAITTLPRHLTPGTHTYTAHFVPSDPEAVSGSVSDPVTVRVR